VYATLPLLPVTSSSTTAEEKSARGRNIGDQIDLAGLGDFI
jgi:hypothetical protein